MRRSIEEALQFIEENDVKFVRLVFCDIFGTPKNVAVMADRLAEVFERGAGFDVSALDGFMNIEESDLLLFPDPSSMAVLPWRPSTGRVVRMYCDIRYPNGDPFVGDGRYLLRQAMQEAEQLGLGCRFGTECEFYLFEMDEEGRPTMRPQDRAGYLDLAPLDKGENVRRDICLALEDMGLFPEGSHHEKGPGQNEVWCRGAAVMQAADDFITYKSVVRTIAAQNGLFASFMPKPLGDKSGNGLHINMLLRQREPAATPEELEQLRSRFMAGILARIGEMTLFLNTTTNSYQRFGSFDAPKYISWSQGNRAQLLRVPLAKEGAARVELRSPDPLCNPYLAFTLLLRAGMEGIRNRLPLCAPADFDFARADSRRLSEYQTLPGTLGKAIALAENSAFIRQSLPEAIVEKVLACKRDEWENYMHTENRRQFEHTRYFERL